MSRRKNKGNVVRDTTFLYEQLISMRENGCTDSDICDFCELHNLSLRDAERYLANHFAPDQCKGCDYVVCHPSAYPCSGCKRICTKDYYKNTMRRENS